MDKNEPRKITQKRLVRVFKDIKRLKTEESRFCFLIGAGASKSSGIKTGWELCKEWYDDLKQDLSEDELKEWQDEVEFDEDKIASFYPHLYRKRYEVSPQMGYEEFKKLMENIEPGIGYVILSQILADEKHNFVITTNFDYLVEDSVRLYTTTKPFTAGHETLAEFVSSQTERPTIIKVHRDLFLQPFNDGDETQKLKGEWEKALLPIVRNFNLLVIGYGGNDGSLMEYLIKLNGQERKPIYWCVRDENELSNFTQELLQEDDFIVKIQGFDELMIALNDVLGYRVFETLDDPENHPFVHSAKQRITDLNSMRKSLLEKLPKNPEEVTEEEKEIFTGPFRYMLQARIESDVESANEIYQKALREYPDNADILGQYAAFQHERLKDFDAAKKNYEKAISINSNDPETKGNYALLLLDIKDYESAKEHFEAALELDPKHANNNANYATLLQRIGKDYLAAEKYIKKALESAPENVVYNANYALFLENVREDFDEAEKYYEKALELGPRDPISKAHYASFLVDIRKDYGRAEILYKEALQLAPENVTAILDYADFLTTVRKDHDEAENFYKKSLKMDPQNHLALTNYALFLKETRKNYDKAEEYYTAALNIDPSFPNTIANYAVFLSDIRQRYDEAEEYFERSLKLIPDDGHYHGNYAHHLLVSKEAVKSAELHIDKAFELYDEGQEGLNAELWFYRFVHYKKWHKKAEKELEKLVEAGAKSIGWNFQPHVEIAEANKHPKLEKVKEFAKFFGEP